MLATTDEVFDKALTDRSEVRRNLDAKLAILRAIMQQPVSPEYLKGIALAIEMMEDVRETVA